MKKPKPNPTLLEADVIELLREDRLPEPWIQFFGTISGMAKAINNPYPGKRPIIAAHSMMSKPRTVEMFKEWSARVLYPRQHTKGGPAALEEALTASDEHKAAAEAIARDRAEQWQEENLRPGFNGPEEEDDEGEE